MKQTVLLFFFCLCYSYCPVAAQFLESEHHSSTSLGAQLRLYFDSNVAFQYEQILKREGIRHSRDATYQALREAGITHVHDQLRVMQALRTSDEEDDSHHHLYDQEADLPTRLLFSINTGRSGSRYLASILDSCVGVLAEHEPGPGPGGSRNMMRERWQESFKERARVKNSAIRRTMQSGRAVQKGATIYAETNPNFKVWIWDVVLEEFGRQESKPIDILVVRKYIPALLKSIYELGWYQKGSRAGESWLPTANGVNSLIRPLGPDATLDPYDKIISSIINTEAVAQHIMQRYGDPQSPDYLPHVTFYEYSSEELFNGDHMLEVLVRDLGLTPTIHTTELVGVPMDKYRNGKEHKGELRPAAHVVHTTLEECEKRVAAYLAACEKRGIELPSLPHLQRYHGFSYN